MDYAMLSKHSIQSVTDQESQINMVPIAAAAATAVLPEQAAIWSYPVSGETLNLTIINMVNSMMIRVHLSGEVNNLSEEQRTIVKDGVKKYKEIRKYIPKATPFYPLGIPQYNGEWQCVGYTSAEKVFLTVWRMDSETDKISIPVAVSKASIIYGADDVGICSISDNGVSVQIKEKYNAIIIEAEKDK